MGLASATFSIHCPNVGRVKVIDIFIHYYDSNNDGISFVYKVNSLPGFNLAVTILFSRFDFDKPTNFKDCNETTEKFTPLNEFDVDWMYPGKGISLIFLNFY